MSTIFPKAHGTKIDINPRILEGKIATRTLDEGAGVNRNPPPSTVVTIHPFDRNIGTYNKLHLYFQLNQIMWCLIDFHGNDSHINDVTASRHLGFLNFQILVKFEFFLFKMTRKQHLAIEIHKTIRVYCEVVSIQ